MSNPTNGNSTDVREDLAMIVLAIFVIMGIGGVIAANIYNHLDGFLTVFLASAITVGVGVGYYVLKVKNW